jgi:hypothetical protein
MRIALSVFALAAFSMGLFLFSESSAGEKKKAEEVTLKGTITCGKCDLGKTAQCATVLVVKKDGKDQTIFFDAASHKKYHDDVCAAPAKGTVVGTTKKDGDKVVISVKKLEYDK